MTDMMFFVVGCFAMFGGFVQAVSGFGTGTIIVAVLPYFFDIRTAPALSSSMCLLINFLLMYQNRKYIKWKKIILPGIIYLTLSQLAIQLVGNLNLDVLQFVFGAFLIVLGIYSLFFSKKASIKGTTLSAVLSSGFSGFTSGLFGIGGPPLGLYYAKVTDTREECLGNMNFIFTITSIFALISRIVHGYYTASLIPYTLFGTALVMVGLKIGNTVGKKLNMDAFRKVVYSAVGLSGVLTIIEQLTK